METDRVPSQPLKCPILSLPVHPFEESDSKTISFKYEKVTDHSLKNHEEECGSDDKFIESAHIGRNEIKKEELDQKEPDLCLKESSYIRQTRTFKKIQVKSHDRNMDKELDNDVLELKAIKEEPSNVIQVAIEELNYSNERPIKSEIIEQEEIHIKQEEENEDVLKSEKTQTPGIQLILYQCPECHYSTSRKCHLKRHSLRHKKPDEIDWYSCQECTYKTCQKGNLKVHAETHKSKEDREKLLERKRKYRNQTVLHRCRECPYSTYRKDSFKAHSIRHKKADEIDWYCCQECPYKTYVKKNLQIHAEIHNNIILKCSKCSYETLRLNALKRHQIKHKTYVQWLHCSECIFKTYLPSLLRNHVLAHKSDAFKCSKCSYQSRTKQLLTVHQLKHESMDKWHSCLLCDYKTHDKNILKSHRRQRHGINSNNPKQIEIFKSKGCFYDGENKASVRKRQLIHDRSSRFQCSDCGYTTACKSNLKKHRVLHHGENAERWHRCLECTYKTLEKTNLRQHVNNIHKSADEVRWLECSQCSFKTAYKQSLRRHALMHKEEEEIEWFHCYECGLKTKYKSHLVNHIWTHKKKQDIADMLVRNVDD